jgi:hypothetical protein
MSTETSAEAVPAPASSRRIRRGLTVLAAAAGASLVWVLADPIGGIDLAVRAGDATRPVGFGGVLFTGLLAGVAGWALLAVLERALSRPRRTWTAIAVVVLVLSLAGPLASGADAASRTLLTGLHLIVGAVLIAGLRRTDRGA